MEKNTGVRVGHAILGICAIGAFLGLPFQTFWGPSDYISGYDLIKEVKRHEEYMWMTLFIILPALSALAALKSNPEFRIISALAMYLPVLIWFIDANGHFPLYIGNVVYCLIPLLMLFFILFNKKEPQTPWQQPQPMQPTPPAPQADPIEIQVRQYDTRMLENILGNTSMYRAELVGQCRRELEIRRNSQKFMAEVSEYDDAKIAAILAEPQLYSDELIYCCELTAKARQAERK